MLLQQQQQQQQQLLQQQSSATPTLRVMRLYKPDLYRSDFQPSLSCAITSFLTLPDSFGVIHVGETFTAYLGVLNPSPTVSISKLYVTVKLQTPSRRFDLVGGDDEDGVVPSTASDVPPSSSVDMIVAKTLDESGTHTLRVSVQYGQGLTLRKFYKFNVDQPLRVWSTALRVSAYELVVQTSVTNLTDGGITIFDADFRPGPGLAADRLGGGGNEHPTDEESSKTTGGGTAIGGGETTDRYTAADLFDRCGRVEAKSTVRYLFHVSCLSSSSSPDPTVVGGGGSIAVGADLGKAVFSWRKAMGESGRVESPTVYCPTREGAGGSTTKEPGLLPVAHRSGETGDNAAAAKSSRERGGGGGDAAGITRAVTVDPLSPPEKMRLNIESTVTLRLTNHGPSPVDASLHLRLKGMSGVVVSGPSCQGVGSIPPGGSADVAVRLLGIVAGLCQVSGCFVVDAITGKEIAQPPLFNVLVER